jgi:hypothetical protein
VRPRISSSRPEVLAVAEAAAATFKAAFDALARLENDFTRRGVEVAAEVGRRVDEEHPSTGEETFAARSSADSGDPTAKLRAVTCSPCALRHHVGPAGAS